MWFLNFIPDSWLHLFVHGIVVLGLLFTIGGAVLNQIPFIKSYSKIISPLGVLILVAGVFFEGGYGVEMSWRARDADMQKQIVASEQKAKEANDALSVALKNKVQVIHDTKVVIQEKIKQETKVIDNGCVVAPEAIEILNEAAKRPGDSK
jgi:hypothetical protein